MKSREDMDRKLTIGFYKMDLSDLYILLLFVIIMVIPLLIANPT